MNILIAEDNRVERATLRQALERAGFSVIEAMDGNEAWKLVSEGKVDGVVTDVLMPGMDGFRLCHQIRSDARFKRLPVIIYTATYTTTNDELYARAMGAENFLRKPNDAAAVAGTLRAALERTGPQATPTTGAEEMGAMQQYRRGLVDRLEQRNLDLEQSSGALRESNRQLQQILDNLFSFVGLLSPDGVLLEINRAPLEAAGLRREEVVGRPFAETFWWKDAPEIQQQLRDSLARAAGGESVRYDVQVRAEAGKFIAIDFACGPLKGLDGTVEQLVVTAVDITERKQLEQQFLRGQRLEVIGTLASGLAHDMNNILAAMMMAAGLLKERLTEPRDRQMVAMIEASAQRGSGVLRQLLTFSRGLGNERVNVQLRHLVEDVAQLITETFPRNIEIRANAPKGIWTVQADATQLHQVLMNLCINARDAMPDGGQLSLKLENVTLEPNKLPSRVTVQPGPYVLLTVADTGVGIPPENLEKIFEAFFSTKSAERGTGLGLTTVQSILKEHGGCIVVESTVGRGSTFRVYLPATGVVAETEEPSGLSKLPQGGGEMILLVDDEDAVREVAGQVLEAHNYRVVKAANGEEAVQRYVQHRDTVRLVVTDMMMPVMDGKGLIRSLKILDPGVKVVVICGSADDGSKLDFGDAKPVGVVWKPCDTATLLKTVHDALKNGR